MKSTRAEHTVQRGWPNFNQLRLLVIFFATGLGVYLCYLLSFPFLAPLTWALVLGITFLPAHRHIELRIGSGNTAALISVAAVAVLIVVPATFIAQHLIAEIANGAVYLESELRTGDWRRPLNVYPTLSRGVTWLEQQLNLTDTAGKIATLLTTTSTSVLKSSIGQLINVVFAFYILFFLLRDRKKAREALVKFSVLSPNETNDVIERFVETIHATVFGTVVMAAVQGTLGGMMFLWLGLPMPLLWGTIMAMLAIVPVLGAFVIWIPAAIYLALEGQWSNAFILAAWGGIVVASIDNLLYPTLIGNRLKLHTIIALISSFGGLIAFGASGLILGPAVTTVTMSLIRILTNRFSTSEQSAAI